MRLMCPIAPGASGNSGRYHRECARILGSYVPDLFRVKTARKGALMRRVWMTVIGIIATAFGASGQDLAPTVTVTRWPQDRAAAISLSFDDGLNSHLDFVRPILKKHHLNATFFVTTQMGPWEKRTAEWKQLADQGNEVGD